MKVEVQLLWMILPMMSAKTNITRSPFGPQMCFESQLKLNCSELSFVSHHLICGLRDCKDTTATALKEKHYKNLNQTDQIDVGIHSAVSEKMSRLLAFSYGKGGERFLIQLDTFAKKEYLKFKHAVVSAALYIPSWKKTIISMRVKQESLIFFDLESGNSSLIKLGLRAEEFIFYKPNDIVYFCTRPNLYFFMIYTLLSDGTVKALNQFKKKASKVILDPTDKTLFANVNLKSIAVLFFNGTTKTSLILAKDLLPLKVISDGNIKYLFYSKGKSLYKLMLKDKTSIRMFMAKKQPNKVVVHNANIYVAFPGHIVVYSQNGNVSEVVNFRDTFHQVSFCVIP